MSAPELTEPFWDVVGFGGTDCETCGYSFDELRVEQDTESGLYDVVLRTGCYGGASAYELTAGDAAEKVRELGKGLGDDPAVELMAEGLLKRAEADL